MAFQVGQVINGRYRILSHIGQGGMESTFIAEEVNYSTRVRIETFPDDAVQQHLREFQIFSTLRHPNILSILDYGEESDIPYLVTEYTTGGTLRDRYRRGTIVPSNTVVSYTTQLASALDYIHKRGIVHQDVKPESIFVRERSNNILLGDFGTSAYANNVLTGRPGIVGTPLYMAPEQIQGKVEPASDQYALGVVVYEWLSGRLPFGGDSPIEIFLSHATKQVPPLNSLVPGLSLDVGNVVQKALAKNPRDRFNSVSEFAENLERAFQHQTAPGQQPFAAQAQSPNYGSPAPGSAPPPPIRSSNPYPDSARSDTQALPPPPPAYQGQGNPYGAEPIGATQKEPTEQGTELSLFAIARTKLEDDDRAIVGNIYTVEAGISQQRPDDFYGQRFRIRVQDPTAPLPFDILLHVSENVILLGSWYQRLTYNPRSLQPQLLSCSFRLRTQGKSYILVNFYRERQWLKTIRFEFESIQNPALSSSHKL